MTTTKGFTLIELLVVVAIIGILSSVLLSSVNCARKMGEYERMTGQKPESCNAVSTSKAQPSGRY